MKLASIYKVYEFLPKTNCGLCGLPTCMAFASKLLRREAGLDECLPLNEPAYSEQRQNLIELLKPVFEAEQTGIIVDAEQCNGCGNCVVVCPANAVFNLNVAGGKGPKAQTAVLVVKGGRVAIANLKECYRFHPTTGGCRACAESCPTQAIKFV